MSDKQMLAPSDSCDVHSFTVFQELALYVGDLWSNPIPRSYEKHPHLMVPMECGSSLRNPMVSLNGAVKCMYERGMGSGWWLNPSENISQLG